MQLIVKTPHPILLDRNEQPRERIGVPELAPTTPRRRLAIPKEALFPFLILVGCSAGALPDKGSGSQAGAAAGGAGPISAGGATTAGSANGAGTSSGGGAGGNAASGAAAGGGGGKAGVGGNGGSAGAAGTSTGSCSPDYLLCEDFETATVGMAPMGWTTHGKAAVAEDQANHGKRSLKVSPADNGERRIYHATAMLGSQHWGRVYYRVELPTPEAFVHSTLVAFYGKGPTIGDAEFRVVDTVKDAKTGGFANGKHQFLYNVQPQGAEFASGSPYDYTFDDKWHCAEWHVDATDQSYAFYYDGKEVIAFKKGAGQYKDSELPSSFAEVRLGWNNYQSAAPGFTAWLDDFALDDQRVGCLP